VINGTHPIYSIGISLNEAGTSIEVDGGFGTNELFGRITGGPEEIGDVNFTAGMTTSTGISGSDNYLMPECRDCDECIDIEPLAPGSNPETIAQGGSETILIVNGKEDFNWSVSGSGFTMEDSVTSGRSNTLHADADACGTAIITVTDICDGDITIEVRSLGDSRWVQKTTTCVMPGGSTEGDGKTQITGGRKQTQAWHGAGGSACNPPPNQGCAHFAPDCVTRPQPVCIAFNCPELTGNPDAFESGGPACCCSIPCNPEGNLVAAFMSNNSLFGDDLAYFEWECN
jgi:hypothetical protein